jgi:hypothetical protein
MIRRRVLTLGFAAAATRLGCRASMPKADEPDVVPSAESPPVAVPPPSLRELLASNRTRDPEFSYGLSNHQSMALTALAGLGADDARLAAFASSYGARLRPLRAETPGVSGDVRASLGSPPALVSLIHGFEREISALGRNAVLRNVLPSLLPGLSGGAFHGLIRTAYALDAEDDAELSHALAYFVTVAKPLRPLPPATASASAADLWERARGDSRLKRGFAGSLISDALQESAHQPALDDYVAALAVGPGTLDELARAALDFYVATADFTAIHAVTSTHALRLLLPHVPEPELALRYHFQALLAAWLSVSGTGSVPRPRQPLPTFEELAALALRRDDDHDVKLVFTCREEGKLRGWEEYRTAAAVRLGLF